MADEEDGVSGPDDTASTDDGDDEGSLRAETRPGRCARSASGEPTAFARRSEHDLRISLRNFRWYCDPAPVFTARRTEDGIDLQPKPPVPPVARCTCLHDVTIVLPAAPEGTSLIRILDAEAVEVARTSLPVIPGPGE